MVAGIHEMKVNGQMVQVCLSESIQDGKWNVILWTYPNVIATGYWHIINTETGKTTRIGRVGAKRTNYFDEAVAEAKRRNMEAK